MSFATFLEVVYVDNQVNIDVISEELKSILTEDGIHFDVLEDLRAAFAGFAGSEAMFNVSASYLSYLVERIARLQPAVSFHVRGRGEELRDVWVREVEDGEVIFSVGNFL